MVTRSTERPVNSSDVIDILGPQDDFLIARIIATGATPSDVAAAYGWLNADDVMGPDGSRPNSGGTAAVYAILQEELSSMDPDSQGQADLKPSF